MNRLQLTTLFSVTLIGNTFGGLLPGDAGYQYDRPAFTGDFGRRTNDGNLGRFPGRPSPNYGSPVNTGFGSNFGLQQQNGFGFGTGVQQGYRGNQGYQGYQGYQGNAGSPGFPGFQGNNLGFQGFQSDGNGNFQGFNDGTDGGRQVPRPYNFQYEVRDAASGNDYGQRESGDATGTVRGEYRVLLPDSRTQIVRYQADDANGYVADVRYEGQAQFARPAIFGTNNAFFGSAANIVPGFQQGRGAVGGGYNIAGATDGGFNGNVGNFAGSNQYLPPSAAGATGSYGK